jgi:hypothetical protein
MIVFLLYKITKDNVSLLWGITLILSKSFEKILWMYIPGCSGQGVELVVKLELQTIDHKFQWDKIWWEHQ